ncbi:General substrate transporter [Metarhizium album ARSEF 1941]|uniref:General substrate transporter n=1 Tax=Metarhizium album (strain ARSEF 1941) TaxID=1081103 RepID=A0A0B2WJG8_METAS|nr:General substrate transporter [Metarhizium album ARSEF 1941]KHN94073.1 General substrate transporter [Metarhizium album ARSEF 1941]
MSESGGSAQEAGRPRQTTPSTRRPEAAPRPDPSSGEPNPNPLLAPPSAVKAPCLGSARSMDTFWFPQLSPGGHDDTTSRRVRRGFDSDKELVFLTCCRQYPKAVGWSLLLFLTVVLEAYGKSLLFGFVAFPAFQRKYGTLRAGARPGSGDYEISSAWQIGLQNATYACELVGLLTHGYITYIVGYRKVMMGSLLWLCMSVFPAVFANSITTLLVSQALCAEQLARCWPSSFRDPRPDRAAGIPWGVIQTLAATYAAEVVPSGLRPYVLSNINICWVAGQLLGTGVLRAMLHNTSEWSYRLPVILQWAWAVPLLVGVSFAPESPWWFVRHERPRDARRSLGRLCSRPGAHIDDSIALMEHINGVEKELNYGGATYSDLFKGVNCRRTEISCVAWICQALSGGVLTGYAAYFFEQAGFSPSDSFSLSTGMYGMALVGGAISWLLVSKIGRRKLYVFGLASTVVLLSAGGIVSAASASSAVGDWNLGGLIILMTFVYDLTIGPVCYIVVAEVPSTRLRVKTVALARVVYNAAMMFNAAVVPNMLNPAVWGIHGKSCFLYAGTALCCLVWCLFRLPETKGLSYLELDILFEKKAPARKFAEVQDRLSKSAYLTVSRAERLTDSWHGWLAYS